MSRVSASTSAAYNTDTNTVRVQIEEINNEEYCSVPPVVDEPVCECCAVPMCCRIPFVLLFMLLGAFAGYLSGGLAAFIILPALQWSLFMGTSLNGWQNVDALVVMIRTGKCLKTPSSSMCNCAKCGNHSFLTLVCRLLKLILLSVVYLLRFVFALLACLSTCFFGLGWCPWAGLITGYTAAAIIASKITTGQMRKGTFYDAVEESLIAIRILKVKDNKLTEGKSKGRRKLDGTKFFYFLLCSPFIWLLSSFIVCYTWLYFAICGINESTSSGGGCDLAIVMPVTILSTLLLPAVSLGLYFIYMKQEMDDFVKKYNEMLEKMQNFSDVPLTEEEENWVRLSFLLVEEGSVWVANIITKYLHDNSLQFAKFLNANKRTLQKHTKGLSFGQGPARGSEKQKLLSSEQYELLFPPAGEADICSLDLTLLVNVIGLLKVLPAPPRGWKAKVDPPASDLDQASDLVRMRLMRNHLYAHIVECAIKTVDFERHWDKLVEILIRLGAKIEELDKIKDRDVTKEQRNKISKEITTLFSGDLPDAEEFAQNRMKELAENHRLMLQLNEDQAMAYEEARQLLFV